MTEAEILMYKILGRISESDAPLVFKGALITRLVLAEGGYTALDRHTRDIDANWIGVPPSMDEIVDTVNRSLGDDLCEQFYVTAFREYGERMSAGLSIREKSTDKEVITMDIDMRPVAGSRLYYYGDTGIKGVLVNEILADKITVLSKKVVFRRAKDLVDVYALTHCVELRAQEIFDMIRNSSRELGGFTEFHSRREDVEHAYSRLQCVDGKPSFDEVYPYLENLIRPFAERDETPRLWNSETTSWDEERVAIKDACTAKPSVVAALRAAEQERRGRPKSSHANPKRKTEPER